MSAMTTLAYLVEKNIAVYYPSPEAAPVMMIVVFLSIFIILKLNFG